MMFGLPALQIAAATRSGSGLWVGETVATAGLIAVVVALARTGRVALSAAAVASWIGCSRCRNRAQSSLGSGR